MEPDRSWIRNFEQMRLAARAEAHGASTWVLSNEGSARIFMEEIDNRQMQGNSIFASFYFLITCAQQQ